MAVVENVQRNFGEAFPGNNFFVVQLFLFLLQCSLVSTVGVKSHYFVYLNQVVVSGFICLITVKVYFIMATKWCNGMRGHLPRCMHEMGCNAVGAESSHRILLVWPMRHVAPRCLEVRQASINISFTVKLVPLKSMMKSMVPGFCPREFHLNKDCRIGPGTCAQAILLN